jgi:hypothetical protein
MNLASMETKFSSKRRLLLDKLIAAELLSFSRNPKVQYPIYDNSGFQS